LPLSRPRSIKARSRATQAICRRHAKFTELDKWHISKPDIVISMRQPYTLRAKGGDEYYDVDIDPGFTEDVYVQTVETKPDLGFKVVHHCTTNLVEDPESDPVGLFLNEYAVGKNADISPPIPGV
jgi:hypothetical protein